MQKKLLTLAVAGAFAAPGAALAQSSVEVYGFVNMSFGNVEYSKSTSGAKSVNKWDVSQGASNVGFRGRESLGGGLTAWFQIESNAPMARTNDQSATVASRNSAVGMQGGFGNVFMGQWTTPWSDLDGLWSIGTVGFWGPVTSVIGRRETTGTAPNPNCGGGHGAPAGQGTGVACDQIEANGVSFWRRFSNALFYQSPVMNGLQGKFAYLPNETKSVAFGSSVKSNASAWSASVQWSGMGGAARVGAAYDSHKDFNVIGETDTGWSIKGGYNLGVADIGLAYEQIEYKLPDDCKLTNMAAAVAFPIGQGAIRGSYAVADDMDDSGCPGATKAAKKNGSTVYNIGYDHRFSKRTTVGFGYAKIDNEKFGTMSWTGLPPNQQGGASTTMAGSDVSTFFVNVIHRF